MSTATTEPKASRPRKPAPPVTLAELEKRMQACRDISLVGDALPDPVAARASAMGLHTAGELADWIAKVGWGSEFDNLVRGFKRTADEWRELVGEVFGLQVEISNAKAHAKNGTAPQPPTSGFNGMVMVPPDPDAAPGRNFIPLRIAEEPHPSVFGVAGPPDPLRPDEIAALRGRSVRGSDGEYLPAVRLAELLESATNPRRQWDAAKLAELAKSVAAVGVLQPLVVRPLPQLLLMAPSIKWEIVAGARRFRAAGQAKLATVPVIVRNLTDDQVLEIQITENLQRADVHPLDEAAAFKALANRNKTLQQIAGRVGKSEGYVARRLKLNELADDVRDTFAAGDIGIGHAELLARLPESEQAKALEKCWQKNWGEGEPEKTIRSVDYMRGLISEELHIDLAKAPWDLADAELVPAAGACSTCPKRAGNAPSLFDDLNADTCTDRACHEGKLAAHIVRVRESVRLKPGQKPPPLVSLDAGYGGNPKTFAGQDVLGWGTARKAEKGCASAELGISVGESDAGKKVRICRDPKCTTCHGYIAGKGGNSGGAGARHKPTEEEKKAAEADRRKAELDTAIQDRTFAAIIEKVKAPLAGEDLRAVAKVLLDTSDFAIDEMGGRVQADGTIGPKQPDGGNSNHLSAKAIDQMNERALCRVIICCTLDDAFRFGHTKDIAAAAKRYGIDTKAIAAQVKADLKETAKQPKPAAKPGKKAKGRRPADEDLDDVGEGADD